MGSNRGNLGEAGGRYVSLMGYYDSVRFSGDYIVLNPRQCGSVGLTRDQLTLIGGHWGSVGVIGTHLWSVGVIRAQESP